MLVVPALMAIAAVDGSPAALLPALFMAIAGWWSSVPWWTCTVDGRAVVLALDHLSGTPALGSEARPSSLWRRARQETCIPWVDVVDVLPTSDGLRIVRVGAHLDVPIPSEGLRDALVHDLRDRATRSAPSATPTSSERARRQVGSLVRGTPR